VGGLLSSANDDAALDNLRKNYGDNSLTKDDVLPEELKAHAPAERESINAQIAALERSGYTGEADKMRNRLDRVDDNERADAKDAWAMAHGDKQLAAQEKHYRALEGQAASALNLKKQERQDLSDAMDAYTVADGNLKMLDKTADEKTLKAATFARDAAALRLQPYGIKIGGDGQGSFHASVLEDSTTGEKGLAITNQKTGDSTYKTAAELKGGKAGEGVEAKSARLFGDGKPKEEMTAAAKSPADQQTGGGLLAPKSSTASATTQSFNEVGYSTTESTIAGAKRGDQRAKKVLLQMLDEGGLTRQERASIEKVLGK
jgi:hypothetical protein